MKVKTDTLNKEDKLDVRALINTIFKALGLAMGVCVIVLSALKKLDVSAGMVMLGIGLASLGMASLNK